MTPSVSVIIATYNRAALLEHCLDHLSRQTFGRGDEVIVVDNGSTDATPRVIENAAARFPVPLRHLTERSPGKSRALARAFDIATGDILAFTDDDVEVDAGWLPAIRASMADPATALIGGSIAARWDGAPPRWIARAAANYGRLTAPLALMNYGPRTDDLGHRTALGANLAVRRDVLARIGGFAPHLGKLRGTLLSGEDDDLCRRVQAAGLRALYCPDVRVRHWVPAERMRVAYYLSWFFWSGITNAALDATSARSGRSFARVPLYLIRQAATSATRGVRAALAGNVAGMIEPGIDLAFTAGYAAHRWGWKAQS